MSAQAVARLTHYTPLRYPGGKGRLAPYIKKLIVSSGCADGLYVEPYAGGAAIALELLFHEYVDRIHINDISVPVYAFWHSVLENTEEICRLIVDTPITVPVWQQQRRVFFRSDKTDLLGLGFATFFLNRTNRSGIFNGGVIGGLAQTGPWKIDARYNARDLAFRIEQIAKLKSRIKISNMDASKLLVAGGKKWPTETFIYCDPPYYVQGSNLYYNFYKHDDHVKIAHVMSSSVKRQKWVVSYDNVQEIREIYSEYDCIYYKIGYSARSVRAGREVMFFGPGVPPLAAAGVPVMQRSRRKMGASALR